MQKWNPKNDFDYIHYCLQGLGIAIGTAEQNVGKAVGKITSWWKKGSAER